MSDNPTNINENYAITPAITPTITPTITSLPPNAITFKCAHCESTIYQHKNNNRYPIGVPVSLYSCNIEPGKLSESEPIVEICHPCYREFYDHCEECERIMLKSMIKIVYNEGDPYVICTDSAREECQKIWDATVAKYYENESH